MYIKFNGVVTGLQVGDTAAKIEIVWMTGAETEADAITAGRYIVLNAGTDDLKISAFQAAGYVDDCGLLNMGTAYTPSVRITESRYGAGVHVGDWSQGVTFRNPYKLVPTVAITTSATSGDSGFLDYVLAQNTIGLFEFDFYDSGDGSVQHRCRVYGEAGKTTLALVDILTSGSTTQYRVSASNLVATFFGTRTVGWHHVAFNATGTGGSEIWVDGVNLYTGLLSGTGSEAGLGKDGVKIINLFCATLTAAPVTCIWANVKYTVGGSVVNGAAIGGTTYRLSDSSAGWNALSQFAGTPSVSWGTLDLTNMQPPAFTSLEALGSGNIRITYLPNWEAVSAKYYISTSEITPSNKGAAISATLAASPATINTTTGLKYVALVSVNAAGDESFTTQKWITVT